jgi:uncharacterized short protein YbdD (DUF466 family)
MEEYNGILLKCDSSKEFVDLDEMGSFFTDIAGLYEDIIVFELFLRNVSFPVEKPFLDFIEKGRWPKLSDEYRLKVYKIESNSPPILHLFTLQNISTAMSIFVGILEIIEFVQHSKEREKDIKYTVEEELHKRLREQEYFGHKKAEENYFRDRFENRFRDRIIRRAMRLAKKRLYIKEVKEITLPPKNRDNDKPSR